MTSQFNGDQTGSRDNREAEENYQQVQKLLGEGDAASAINCLEQFVKERPDFALAFNDLGVLYYRQKEKDRSLNCYEQAVSLDPDNINFRKNLADFYFVEQGRLEDAMQIYLSVLQDDPEDIDALLVAGHICTAIGKADDARIFYERVLDVEPWNFDATERLEKLNG
jgi:tetratricopeptide (TPR) repeat protein